MFSNAIRKGGIWENVNIRKISNFERARKAIYRLECKNENNIIKWIMLSKNLINIMKQVCNTNKY